VGAQNADPPSKFRAVDFTGHDHVRNHQVNLLMLHNRRKSAGTVLGVEGCKSHILEVGKGYLKDIHFIVYDQHRTAQPCVERLDGIRRKRVRGIFDDGQIKRDGGALTKHAVDAEDATGLFTKP